MLQLPVQHSASRPQTSPACVQKELPMLHLPAAQSCEQQSAFSLQSLPEVLQVRLSGAQSPASQEPLQHSLESPQAPPSDEQALAEQLPAWQLRPQQSVPTLHATPGPPHACDTGAHRFEAASHRPEQQLALSRQASPNLAHCTPGTLIMPPAPAVSSPAAPPSPAPPDAPP